MFGSDGSWLGWFWFLRFRRARVLTEPAGSGSEVAAGRLTVLVGLAVWLVGVYSVGQARVCFKALATAVFTGGHFNSTTTCLM